MVENLSLIKPFGPDCEPHLPVVSQIQVTRNCNLACGYCFQEHSGGIIDLSTVETILARVIDHNLTVDPLSKEIQIYWHGGEPLLAGIDFFRAIIRLEAQYPGISFQNRVQTNATLMNDDLARLFAENQFQVGFSLDGPQEIHDRYRRFHGSRRGSFEAARRGIDCYRARAQADQVAVIAVVTRTGIHRAADLFHFFKELRAVVQLDIYDVRWLDLIQDSGELSGWSDLAPRPEEVGRFLIELFDLWLWISASCARKSRWPCSRKSIWATHSTRNAATSGA
jgi:uncharacterized protein